VEVFDGGVNANAPVDVGGTPIGLFTDSDGNVYAIVADGNLQDDQLDNVSLYNVTAGAPVGGVAYTTILNTSSSPAGMIEAAQGSDGNFYITNPLDNSIVVLDSAGDPVRTIDFEPGPPDQFIAGPRPVSVVASGDKVYATVAFADAVNPDAAHLRVIELTTGAVVAEAFVTEPGDYHTALQTDMAVSPSGDRIYVTNPVDNSITVIDAEDGAILTSIQFEDDEIFGDDAPARVMFAPDGTRAYVVDQDGNVSVISFAATATSTDL
jgi:YVTN family beta-propeller protein